MININTKTVSGRELFLEWYDNTTVQQVLESTTKTVLSSATEKALLLCCTVVLFVTALSGESTALSRDP